MNVVDLKSFALNMVLNTVKIDFHVLHLAMQNKMSTLICGFKIVIENLRSTREMSLEFLQKEQHPKCFSNGDNDQL